ncbi:MAG: nucleoside triphosphate pyrophosphohydrolase [Desulfuromonadales bacterium]|nr:nucleoside triphosphate pyrophosphohydrolase [Desulfuromonadales bacterium]
MSIGRASQSFDRLLQIMATLRSPHGCAWDASQTPESLKPYLVEEAYEVMEAIDDGNPAAIREELGDLLLQIIFQARIFEERGEFDMAAVAEAIADKLVRRHPHVFAGETDDDPVTLAIRWDQIKAGEKRDRGEENTVFAGIPRHLPALARAQKSILKAQRAGFLDLDPAALARAAAGQLATLPISPQGEGSPGAALGDLLFTLVGLGASLGLDAEEALRQATDRFCRRATTAGRDGRATAAAAGKK